jgi:hypothetical protein
MLEGDIRCEVAVLRLLRRFELDGNVGAFGRDSGDGEREQLLESCAQIGHGEIAMP